MFLSFYKYLLLLFEAFLDGDSGAYGLYILAQTGFGKSGSDPEYLHASVGENVMKCMNIKRRHFLFYGCSVSEAQTEIPVSL